VGRWLHALLRAFALLLLCAASFASASAQGDAKRGEYLAKAGGCVGCHTEDRSDAVRFAGGRAIKTSFGTFFGPNITPHPDTGIGRWTEADFVRAMRSGVRPDGSRYYPVFPYPSYTQITDSDLRDLWAYLRSLPPVGRTNREHELRFPYGWRFLNRIWNWLFFTPGPFVPDSRWPEPASRGAYLVNALGHCGECHTPRNFLGGAKRGRFLAGRKGMPNLTPTGIGKWSDEDLKQFFLTGVTPDGDATAVEMDEVVRNTTSQFMPGDLAAMIAYLRSLPPLPDEPKVRQ